MAHGGRGGPAGGVGYGAAAPIGEVRAADLLPNEEQQWALLRVDAEEWRLLREVYLRALEDSPQAFARPRADEERLPEEVWRRRASRDLCLLAWAAGEAGRHAGEALGLVIAVRLPRGLPSRPGSSAATFGVWVAPAARRRGLGGQLVDEVLCWARAGGCDVLVMNVAEGNAAAVRLYERRGFVLTGVAAPLPPPRSHIRKLEMALKL